LIKNKKYSVEILKTNDEFYTPEFKLDLKKKISEFFTINLVGDEITDKRYLEAFNLCYSLVIQENIGAHAEIFNGFYSFFRGLKITALFGVFVNILIVVKELLFFCGWSPRMAIFNNIIWAYNSTFLVVSVLLLTFFFVSYLISDYRCDNFSKHFANSIYRSFIVYFDKQKAKHNLVNIND